MLIHRLLYSLTCTSAVCAYLA